MGQLIIENPGELQSVIDRYSDMLFKIAYLRMGNTEDAEDIVQEVFCQYIKRMEGFEGPEHEKAWLIKVTLNACRKIWRSAWRRHQADIGETPMEVLQGDRQKQESDPAQDLIAKEEGQKVMAAVMALPPKYRDVIHLFYYEDMSVKQIAEMTGYKESTITSQLTRGRDLLKKRLKEEWDFA